MTDRIRGKVAKILNSREIVITVGQNQGVSVSLLIYSIHYLKFNFVNLRQPTVNHLADLERIMSAIATQAEYRCDRTLNLYKTPAGQALVTQAAAGRQLRCLRLAEDHSALQVKLCADDYPGWLLRSEFSHLSPASAPDQPPVLSPADIQARIPEVIAFIQAAMAVPHEYLWGGAVAPNYDCSGLMQAAFAAAGIRLPRDSYQQEAFAQAISWLDLQAGDLIFFGTPERTTHVALYLGNGAYVHSSGRDQGRNGIGIDSLEDLSHPVSQRYYQQLRGFGRITHSYQPGDITHVTPIRPIQSTPRAD